MTRVDVGDGGAKDDRAREPPQRSRGYVGQTIANKYQVIGLIGEGGMGAVYEVKHLAIGRRFAIKFLRPEAARSDSTVARFKREAESAGRLENEHVVAVVDVGTTDEGAPYLVMEYLQGEDLGTLLGRCGPLPVARAIRLVLQVCRGLRAAHALGMIHRDLKPSNLFVVPGSDGNEIVKILDFGIVKLAAQDPEAVTRSGLTLGTPHYMSPEQARGDIQIDGRTDIYSVGVLLYELLTGERPHPGDNATTVLFHLLKQDPVRIEALRPGLPVGLGDAIHRAFAFDAVERFPDVTALSEALAPYSASRVSDDFVPKMPLPGGLGVSPKVPVLDASSGTLSSTALHLPQSPGGGDRHTKRVAAIATGSVTPGSAAAGKRRVLGGVVAVAMLVFAVSLSLFGPLRGARSLESSSRSSPSAPVLGAVEQRPIPERDPSPPAVSRQALERAIEPVSADGGAVPGRAPPTRSSVLAGNPPSPTRPAPRAPAPPASTRPSLREKLYEP
jgi:serine/threonine protein kinase